MRQLIENSVTSYEHMQGRAEVIGQGEAELIGQPVTTYEWLTAGLNSVFPSPSLVALLWVILYLGEMIYSWSYVDRP